MAKWIVMRAGIRYVAAQCVQSWAMGSGYKYHRNDKGCVYRFWRKKSAEQFVDSLNTTHPKDAQS